MLPEHKVKVRRSSKVGTWFVVTCSVCGTLGYYATRQKAENRKSTHDRGQDAGRD